MAAGNAQGLKSGSEIKDIVASDLAGLRLTLIDMMKQCRYFECDICTGNFRINCESPTQNLVCDPVKAFDYFVIYFGDKCFLKKTVSTGDGVRSKIVAVSRDQLHSIFNTLGETVTYNSRLDLYNQIPEWDGVPRIRYFMRDAFKCDANPNFFLLYLTAIIGMIKDPLHTYVPYFFDFVGKKGVGKSLLHTFLVGDQYVLEIEPASRAEDVFTQIYGNNAIIAIDDECNLTGGSDSDSRFSRGWSDDKLKNFVTRRNDVFSRKYGPIERRVRSFIFVRTSNEVKGATDPDERRQIIFESGLPARNPRIFKYKRSYYGQLMAEAKAYYDKHGVYKLTKEEEAEVKRQQAEYFNDETSNYVVVRKFIHTVANKAKNTPHELDSYTRIDGYLVIQWKDFEEYRVKELGWQGSMTGKTFWKIMRGLEAKGEPIEIAEKRHKIFNNNRCTFAYLRMDKYEAQLKAQQAARLEQIKKDNAKLIKEDVEL